jgi:hypothetical protein
MDLTSHYVGRRCDTAEGPIDQILTRSSQGGNWPYSYRPPQDDVDQTAAGLLILAQRQIPQIVAKVVEDFLEMSGTLLRWCERFILHPGRQHV